VRRRLQLRDEIGGIRIFEDFAHHPTAVRETLQTVREAFRPKRLWAIYEPRSATSRRNIFQQEIADALAQADLVVSPPLYRPDKVPPGERLNLDQMIADIGRQGSTAWILPNVDAIVEHVCQRAQSEDLILILSNGGFGNIYEKLPSALRARLSSP
jgi:UDP-N-acetylmuramate: L-alanyl-gamma-D-glutamyl-meso-diaminopimelate ligase